MLDNGPHGPLVKVLAGVAVLLLLLHFCGPQVVPWGLALLILAVVAVVAYVWAVVLRSIYLSHRGPVRTARGFVTRKYMREYDFDLVDTSLLRRTVARAFGGTGGVTVYEDWNFWVAFDVGNTELEFRVPEGLYRELEEGAPVALTYRGEKLIGAVPTEPPKQPGAPPEALAPPPPPPPKPQPPDTSDLRPLG